MMVPLEGDTFHKVVQVVRKARSVTVILVLFRRILTPDCESRPVDYLFRSCSEIKNMAYTKPQTARNAGAIFKAQDAIAGKAAPISRNYSISVI
jgi:hypothetical protein